MAVYTEETAKACVRVRDGRRVFFLDEHDRLTPAARSWLQREHIPIFPAQQAAISRYRTLFGAELSEKPEHMTHLYPTVLVLKDHPRIVFRGKIDCLEAELLLCASLALRQNLKDYADQLEEVLAAVRQLIRCDVLQEKLTEIPTLDEVETGVNYAIVISSIGGLWRYLIGDCVQFVSTYPHRIIITGRTQLCINAFGEELMISNAEQALAMACRECHCSVAEFTVAPAFMKLGENSQATKGYHKWAVEFAVPPADLNAFAATLDKCLTAVNSDYEAKRAGNATMLQLELITLKPGTFLKWMRQRGKVGGQNKVPRLHNDSQFIEQLLLFQI